MSTIINARSPYYIKFFGQSGTLISVEIEIRIWNGLQTSPPTDATYLLNKFPKTEATGNYVVFEISELIRDYLQTEYYTEAVDAVWVKVDSSQTFQGSTSPTIITDSNTYLGIDGFGFFEEGSNPRTSTDPTTTSHTPMVLQSNSCIQFVNGREIKIPVFSEPEPTISTDIPDGVWNLTEDFWATLDVAWEATSQDQDIVDSNDSADKIQYLVIDTTNARTGDTITFTSTQGNSQTFVITLEQVCSPRYDNIRGIFYNKFGALQTFWLAGRNNVTTSTTSEQFKRNTLDFTTTTPSYSTYKHAEKRFNVQARQSIVTNTTLIDECLNEPIEQLLMSEQVWLEDESLTTKPVNLKSSSLLRKTHVNDKTIQYSLEFEYAYDKIQNVR